MDAMDADTNKNSMTDLEMEALDLQNLFGLDGLTAETDSSINMYYYNLFKKEKQTIKGKKKIILIKTGVDNYETYDEDADQLVNRCGILYINITMAETEKYSEFLSDYKLKR
jgi:hypothetical protein